MILDLKINDVSFVVGTDTGKSKLISGGFKKSGFLTRRRLKTPSRQTLYFAKNCTIKCFDGDFDYYPVLGNSPQDLEYMCGTSCYVFINRYKIVKIIFQVIAGKIQAISANHMMKELMNKIYENPINADTSITSWEEGDELFICELNSNKENAYFHWSLR